MIVGQRIKSLRKGRHLTQEQLGEILNLNKTTISHYENGSRVPSIDVLIQISDYFEVSINYILGLENNTHSDLQSVKMSDEEINLVLRLRKSSIYEKTINNSKRTIQILETYYSHKK